MNFSHERADRESVNVEYVLETLRTELPDIASGLVAATHDMSNPAERSFAENPDDPAEHSPRWHQHGILKHSEKFLQFIDEDVPDLMDHWGMTREVYAKLNERIDGTSKASLLRVVSLLHDVGKFTSRRWEKQRDGALAARFTQHEAHSQQLIQQNLSNMLQGMGLSEAQIAYVGHCAGHHFELGKAREAAKDAGGYTMAFARSQEFQGVARRIIHENPDIALEIGLMFMADSFSKTDVAATGTTDEEIANQEPALEREIQQKQLDPRLIDQALQQPVNLEIGRQYFSVLRAQL